MPHGQQTNTMRWMLVPPLGEDVLARTRHRIADLVHLDILTRIGSSYYYIAVHDVSLAVCRFSRDTAAVFADIVDHEVHGIHDTDLEEATAGQVPVPVYAGLFRLSGYIEGIFRDAHNRQTTA